MLSTQLSAEDQAALDQMRDDDAGSPGVDQTPPATGPETEPRNGPDTPNIGHEAPPKPTTPKMVRLEALHEEREARRKAQREVDELRERYNRLDERTNILFQQRQPPAPAETPIPALETDPVGHFAGRLNQADQRLQSATQQTAQQQQQITQALQQLAIQQAVTQRAQGLEREFEAEHPDYGDAVKFVTSQRQSELAAIGIPVEQRTQQIQQEAFALAVHAMQNGRNPADLIYSLAQTRGYKSAAADPQPSPDPSPGPQPPAPAQRLQNIAAGQQQGRSLSQARGSGPVPMTAARLLEMSPKEFDTFQEQHANEFRDIMGR